jgi:hypothetical protein
MDILKIGSTVRAWAGPVPGMRPLEFYGRCLWVVLRLVTAYLFANQISPFFYQQF